MQKPEINITSSGSAFNFHHLLGVLFVSLKLTHVINWSWWFVSLPFYAAPVIAFGVFGIALLLALLVAVIAGVVHLFRRK